MGTLGKEAASLGVKVDSKVIEDLWAKGLTHEEAFNAKYGAALRAAALSKAKVEIATKKVAAQPSVTTAGSMKRSTTATTKDISQMSWDEAIRHATNKVLGKAV
jgi:hypothetical protein